jgi:hypothetical protein
MEGGAGGQKARRARFQWRERVIINMSVQRRHEARLCGWCRSRASVQRCLDTLAKERPPQVQGFVEIANGPDVQRAHFHTLVGEGRYENNRNVDAALGQMFLQGYSAHFRHLHVQYHTARFSDFG